MKPPQKQIRLHRFEGLCRDHGLSVTVQRRVIFEAMADRADHPTADQVYKQVKDRIPGVSRTTVYRVLDTLVRIGVITKVSHPGAAARFDPKTRQHHHLVCLRCDKIIDLENERLNRVALPRVSHRGFEIHEYHIHFRGICPECSAKASKSRRTAKGSSKRPVRASMKKKRTTLARRRKI